jgi:hypothetical protein
MRRDIIKHRRAPSMRRDAKRLIATMRQARNQALDETGDAAL